jgi:hypothetical protein
MISLSLLIYRYSEDKSSSSSVQCPRIKPPIQEKIRPFSQSLDANALDSMRKQKLSSRFTPKTARSVTARWTDRSMGSLNTVKIVFNLFL